MTPNDRALAFIRTYVGYGITAFVAWLLLRTGIDLQGAPAVALVAFAVAASQNVYYLVIRLLETQIPAFGVFLGISKPPKYSNVSDLWASVIRTTIPPFVGAAVVLLASIGGLNFNPETQSDLIVIGIAVVEALYYALAKLLVERWPRSLGWLFAGQVAAPSYPKHV
jgi:hypothetical protein